MVETAIAKLPRSRLDIPAIRREHPLPTIVGAVVKLQRRGNEFSGCCPFHEERTPSFHLFGADCSRFHCFGCGASGDVLDFIQHTHGVGFIEAARLLSGGDLPRAPGFGRADATKPDNSAEVSRIFSHALPVTGTIGEEYLRHRALTPPYAPDVRFSRLPYGTSNPLPCVVFGIREIGGDLIGLQRVYVRSDGRGKADLPKPKLSLGRVSGGAIRLGKPDGSGTMTVCEGPETGMSIIEMMGGPVWVCAGVTNLPKMEFPAEVHNIVIGADNDPAGLRGAEVAADAFRARGLGVRIILPKTGFGDFNDELREARA